jgi:hypothetical protein
MKYKITKCSKCNRNLLKTDKTICSNCMRREKLKTKENDRDLL